MKKVLNQIKTSLLFLPLLLAVGFLFSNCSKDYGSAGTGTSLVYTLSGNASGSQAVPASSNSTGAGTFTGSFDAGTKVMTYTTTWSGLTGSPASGGLFAGAAGQAGTSIAVWSLGSGLGTSGSFSSSTTLTADQQTQLLSGQTFYLLTTAANASGEIRGQISATSMGTGGGSGGY